MADATTKAAPLIIEVLGQKVTKDSKEHKALTMEFEAGKKYMFELAEQVPPREDEVVDVVRCDCLEHLCCGVEVDLEVFVGLLHGFADCFERCGVDDAVWLVLLEGLGKGICVADIGDD